jgi:hypothetical protein
MLAKYEKHVNLKFKYVSSGGVIRVNFKSGEHFSAWSFVGTEARTIPEDEPTMTFNFDIKPDWSDVAPGNFASKYQHYQRLMKYVLLHELGHLMGMMHDFARDPPPQLEEDEEKMQVKIHDYVRLYESEDTCTNPYTKEKCPKVWKALFKWLGTEVTERADKDSISNYENRVQTVLSAGDINWLRKTYPRDNEKKRFITTRALGVLGVFDICRGALLNILCNF